MLHFLLKSSKNYYLWQIVHNNKKQGLLPQCWIPSTRYTQQKSFDEDQSIKFSTNIRTFPVKYHLSLFNRSTTFICICNHTPWYKYFLNKQLLKSDKKGYMAGEIHITVEYSSYCSALSSTSFLSYQISSHKYSRKLYAIDS